MNEKILYEAKPYYGISIPFIVLLVFFILLFIYGILTCIKNPNGRIVDKIGPFVVDAVLLIIIIKVLFKLMH